MTGTKKTESAKKSTTTDVPATESAPKDQAKTPVAGVHEALKGPTTADLNPAYVIEDS